MTHIVVMRNLSISSALTIVGAFDLSRLVVVVEGDGGGAAASASPFGIVGERTVAGGGCTSV